MSDLNVPKGDYLLQTAAPSVLGRQVIQLAKYWGIKTINVVRRDNVKEELQSLGADEVINSTTENLVERVKEITGGKGAYGALDAVGGTLTKEVVASVRDGGKVLVYGTLGSVDVTLSVFDLSRVETKLWTLFGWVSNVEKMQATAKAVSKLLEDRIITPFVGKKFKLEDFKQAILEGDKPARGGKVLLVS